MNAAVITRTITDPANSDISTRDTIHQMTKIVRSQVSNPACIAAALSSVKDLGNYPNEKEIVCAVFYWIKKHIRFATDPSLNQKFFKHSVDPNNVELLILPESLVSIPGAAGDCDDFSMLAATMLLILGIPARFVTIAADPNYPFDFSHVYVECLVDGFEWVPFDCSHGRIPGWEYANYSRKQVWNI